MDKSTQLMKWILFWVFIVLFTLAVLGTLGVVFLDFGTPTDTEREWLVKGLVLEVAACIVALFYSIFGLKPGSSKDNSDYSDIESRIIELESKFLLVTKEMDRKYTGPDPCLLEGGLSVDAGKDFMHRMHPFLATIEGYDVPPPFDTNEYGVSPLYSEIDADISSAKPFDKDYRINSYIGLKVQWKCAYKGIKEKEDCYRIHLNTEKPLFGAYIEVSKDKDVSKLKIINENHPMWVCGEISDISGGNVELINADFHV